MTIVELLREHLGIPVQRVIERIAALDALVLRETGERLPEPYLHDVDARPFQVGPHLLRVRLGWALKDEDEPDQERGMWATRTISVEAYGDGGLCIVGCLTGKSSSGKPGAVQLLRDEFGPGMPVRLSDAALLIIRGLQREEPKGENLGT